MTEAKRLPHAGIATPHYLASAAGLATLARSGNAIDAIVAANLALGVVAPYHCGAGGDLFAIVWDGRLRGYLGSGRSPAATSLDTVRSKHTTMPVLGAHAVTVPGAPDAWFALLERWGTKSLAELAAPAVGYARDGFEVSAAAGGMFDACRAIYADFPAFLAVYGDARPDTVLRQPAFARALELLAAEGRDAYYRGPIAEAIAHAVQGAGGSLTLDDLAAHEGQWVEPLRAPYGDVEVAELPPPTQGVTALEILRVLDGFDLSADGVDRLHLMIEAVKLALADRDQHVTDPEAMAVAPEALLADDWISWRRQNVDTSRASAPAPRAAPVGGTAYLCAADADGLLVSLIQSNFLACGSGVHVPEWGINLNNRGSSFSLDADHVNFLAPAKLPMHTLIPAMALRDGRPWLVFGSEGADAQSQVQVQLLVRLLHDGMELQHALDAPRFRVDWGSMAVRAERPLGDDVLSALRERGHDVHEVNEHHGGMGLAHAIAPRTPGYAVATDPRTEGAALGL